MQRSVFREDFFNLLYDVDGTETTHWTHHNRFRARMLPLFDWTCGISITTIRPYTELSCEAWQHKTFSSGTMGYVLRCLKAVSLVGNDGVLGSTADSQHNLRAQMSYGCRGVTWEGWSDFERDGLLNLCVNKAKCRTWLGTFSQLWLKLSCVCRLDNFIFGWCTPW